MEASLELIFDFLKKNRTYNKELQARFYISVIQSQNSKFEKIISLLYQIANTQSQPKIDNLAAFYMKIYDNRYHLDSFENFVNLVNPNALNKISYSSLYFGMKNQSGWGEKTSALFVKTIYHLHNNEYPNNLKIWNDAPNEVKNGDLFYLPVDAVIISIFNYLENTNWTFGKINKEIEKYYNGKDIEVWDDLWFWGFITQKGTGNDRKIEWNLNKYWTLRESDKNPIMIMEIKRKAEEFMDILKENQIQKSKNLKSKIDNHKSLIPMKLVFATHNKNKFEEVKAMLPDYLELLSLDDIGCSEDIAETAETIEGNAVLKADYIRKKYNLNCFADDTGLEVKSLNNEPGVFSARYAGASNNANANMEKLLKNLEGKQDRSARFKTAIALNMEREEIMFLGICEGEIIVKPRGNSGFGYDPIFQPNGFNKTFAEMTLAEKSEIGHRGKAMRQLIDYLSK